MRPVPQSVDVDLVGLDPVKGMTAGEEVDLDQMHTQETDIVIGMTEMCVMTEMSVMIET